MEMDQPNRKRQGVAALPFYFYPHSVCLPCFLAHAIAANVYLLVRHRT